MPLRTLRLPDDAGTTRLDRALAEAWPDLSRSRLQALIRGGSVQVDGRPETDPAARSTAGTEIVLDEPPPVAAAPAAEPIPLVIVHEDADVVVIDKPAGLVVHPGPGHHDGTLVNALLHHCRGTLSGIGGVERPGIVHRLDRATSGLMVAAKTDRAHRSLSAQFADHGRTGALRRAYLAFAWGAPDPATGTIEAPIGRASVHREKMAVTAGGRHAVTHYRVEERFGGPEPAASLVRCTLETGRTHQIRVHLAHLRHPVVGDPVYGTGFRTKAARLPAPASAAVAALGRQALHAAHLAFAHPATGVVLRFESELPDDLLTLRELLRTA